MIINIRPDRDLVFGTDKTVGFAPLSVSFSASSELPINDWHWSFGDGQQAAGSGPDHVYPVAGAYDVVVTGFLDNDTISRTREDYIVVLNDSITVSENVSAQPGDTIELVISLRNSRPVHSLCLPVSWTCSLGLQFLDLRRSGTQSKLFGSCSIVLDEPPNRRLAIQMVANPGQPLAPGFGPLVRLRFGVDSQAFVGQSATVTLDGYGYYLSKVQSDLAEYVCRVAGGTVAYQACCEWERGNVDLDPFGYIDIGDLVRMVSFMFLGGDMTCYDEADLDGSGLINISDLVQMVGFMYATGTPPATCH